MNHGVEGAGVSGEVELEEVGGFQGLIDDRVGA